MADKDVADPPSRRCERITGLAGEAENAAPTATPRPARAPRRRHGAGIAKEDLLPGPSTAVMDRTRPVIHRYRASGGEGRRQRGPGHPAGGGVET
jgi:hypothetical protein